MNFVILAAGQGSRLQNTFPKNESYSAKPLVDLQGQTAISRLCHQIQKIDHANLHIVLGYQSHLVSQSCPKTAQIVVNHAFNTDTNFGSLSLGLDRISSSLLDQFGCLVVEADCIFSDIDLFNLVKYVNFNLSNNISEIVWTSCGIAQPGQVGGFIETINRNSDVASSYYISKSPVVHFNPSLHKMYGLTWLSPHICRSLLSFFAQQRSKGEIHFPYFHEAVRNFSDAVEMRLYSMHDKSFSFNTYEDLVEARAYLDR